MASEIKWIKITTNIFDDEKMKIIDAMPDADAIIVIWFKLLAQAGKTNQQGALLLTDKLAYTDEMLSTIFNRKISTIRLALTTFEELGMIERGDYIQIANWEKHQNVEGMDRIREQNRLRQQKYRERQRQEQLEENTEENDNVSVTLQVTQHNAPDIDKDKELDIEEDNTKKTSKKVPTPNIHKQEYFTNPEVNELFIEFLRLRKELKARNTERAIKILTNKLDTLSDQDKILTISNSIENSWKGVFPKTNTKGSSKKMEDRW